MARVEIRYCHVWNFEPWATRVAASIRDRFDVDVETTPTTNTGELSVWVDGRRVVRKLLPFVKPGEKKVLAAVEAALA